MSSNAFVETDLFHDAINYWWQSKNSAKTPKGKKPRKPKKQQGGSRDENLHGKTMDGFAAALRDFLVSLGVDDAHIFSGGHLTETPSILPSYFRPSKNWDLVVIANSRFHSQLSTGDGEPVLYVAVEFKSQDKSIGNNQNNRLEESIGNAHDFWTTYTQSGFIRLQPRPWLGYLFVGKYEAGSDDKAVKVRQPHFLAMTPFRGEGQKDAEKFDGPSYSKRYQTFMKQSVGARLYDAGAFIVTDESLSTGRPNHRILLPEFGSANFLRSLKAQILAHYPGASVRPGTFAAGI